MNGGHGYAIHCDYVTVVHVTSAFKSCIYLHNYLFYLGKSKGTVIYIFCW